MGEKCQRLKAIPERLSCFAVKAVNHTLGKQNDAPKEYFGIKYLSRINFETGKLLQREIGDSNSPTAHARDIVGRFSPKLGGCQLVLLQHCQRGVENSSNHQMQDRHWMKRVTDVLIGIFRSDPVLFQTLQWDRCELSTLSTQARDSSLGMPTLVLVCKSGLWTTD